MTQTQNLANGKQAVISSNIFQLKSLVLMSFLLTQIIAGAIPLVAGYGEEWLTGWTYRKSHTLGYVAGTGTNYTLGFSVYFGSGTDGYESVFGTVFGKVYCMGKCQGDFDDIRFTGADGITLYPYSMQSRTVGDNAKFWVCVLADLTYYNTKMYVYYGNSTVAMNENIDETFLFGDDFDTDLSRWGSTGNWVVTTSQKIEGSQSAMANASLNPTYLSKADSHYITKSFEWYFRGNVYYSALCVYCPAFSSAKETWIHTTQHPILSYYSAWWQFNGTYPSGYHFICNITENTWYRYRANFLNATYMDVFVYHNNGTLVGSYGYAQYRDSTVPAEGQSICFSPAGSVPANRWVDYVFLRKWVSGESAIHGGWSKYESYESYLSYGKEQANFYIGLIGLVLMVVSPSYVARSLKKHGLTENTMELIGYGFLAFLVGFGMTIIWLGS